MSQSRKHRGYRSQRVVAERFAANGFPHAEPVGAGRAGTDIVGLIGIDGSFVLGSRFDCGSRMGES